MDAVQDVKDRLAIEDVIGEYLQLKRAGRNFKGLSPFTSEKSPSFVVSPDKNIWHDFSSGKGGDIFSFVMEMEGLDFKGTLDLLARRAGVDLSLYRSSSSADTSKTKDRLYTVLEMAAKFYQVQFSHSNDALEYILKQRRFNKETALNFRIGYAPNNGTALVDYLLKQKCTQKELQQAGLTAQRYRGLSDMFRGRIMIPLQDSQGRVIGFTARILVDEPKAPKYINTPQTLLYDKSRHVYGLHLAKEAIRKSSVAVMVEGNLDVIASHQAGVKNVIATAGTAMTEMHLKALGRFTDDIRAAFDQDRAGQAATERAIPIASKVGVNLSIINIPEGKDPDDLIKKDPKLWQQAIDNNQYAIDWLIDRYKNQLDITSSTGKRQLSDVVLAVVSKLPDKVEQDHYIGVLAKLISISKEALRSKLRQESAPKSPRKTPQSLQKIDQNEADFVKTQNQLLSLALHHPSIRNRLDELKKSMFSGDQQVVYDFLQENPGFSGSPTELAGLQSVANYVKMLVLQHETMYERLEEPELHYEADRLKTRLIEQYVKRKKNDLLDKLHSADEAETLNLLAQVRELDHLLKANKEH